MGMCFPCFPVFPVSREEGEECSQTRSKIYLPLVSAFVDPSIMKVLIFVIESEQMDCVNDDLF